jgi:ribonuclease P protein component
MSVLARPNQLGHPRLGMAISRKVAPSAVTRNRVKRLVRESFRAHKAELGSMDLVVIGGSALARSTDIEIRRSLEKHWANVSRHACDSSLPG